MNKNKKFRRTNNKSNDTKKYEIKRKAQEASQIKEESDTCNDPMWYATNTQLLTDSASLSFGNPIGLPISGNFAGKTGGVMSFEWVPTIGAEGNSDISTVTIAARNIYSYVRHANSGHTNYEAPDLMMYLLAMDSIYARHAQLVRIYGILNTASQLNRYIPQGILRTLGITDNPATVDLADLRYQINRMAVMIGSFCVPASMPYFARHSWMNMNIYADSPTAKGQIYAYNQIADYIYDETTDTKGTMLKLQMFPFLDKDVPTSGATVYGKPVSEWVKHLQDLINAVVKSEDCGIMSGDILKAFGSDNLVKLSMIPTEYSVIPTYNAEVLVQMHNAEVANSVNVSDIKQDAGVIVQTATSESWRPTFFSGHILDIPKDVPTPEDIMVASRLKLDSTSMGSEYIKWMRINFDSEGSKLWSRFGTDTLVVTGTDGAVVGSAWSDCVTTLGVVADFDFHPELHICYGTTSNYQQIANVYTTNNVTTCPESTLHNMHRTALLSMFNVPEMGMASISRGAK